jgi:hypothetical protein
MVIIGCGMDQLLCVLMPEMSVAMGNLFVGKLFSEPVSTVSN